MPSRRSLFAALVAAMAGLAVIRTGRSMMESGIEIQDGGGWAALEAMCCFAAVGVAFS
jgi:hypothetical protein